MPRYFVANINFRGVSKVIGEVMAYGCIPVVSNISSIDNVSEKNGIILKRLNQVV